MVYKILFFLLCFIYLDVTVSANSCKTSDGTNKPDGFYRDTTNCQKFYRCYHGTKSDLICPVGLVFDVKSNVCNWPYLVKCVTKPTTSIPEPVTTAQTTKFKPKPTKFTPKTTNFTPKTTPAGGGSQPAKPCDRSVCKLPDCWCSGPEIPNNMAAKDVPRMVTFTMDDGITQEKYDIYSELFDGKTNPNGCPVKSTYYISGDWTVFSLTKALYDKGHEIGVHTETHRYPISWWKTATYQEYVQEIIGMRTQLEKHGIKNLKGYRQPFLQTGGDNTFAVLKDYGFLYDTSLPTNYGQIWFPYTLNYDTTPKPCVIEPCPKNSYPGLWEISMIPLKDKNNFICSMFDECGKGFTTADEVYQFFKSNFDRHFASSSAPFPLYGHAMWMVKANQKFRKEGLKRFLTELYADPKVYVVSMAQTIDWMRSPTSLANIKKSSGPFSC